MFLYSTATPLSQVRRGQFSIHESSGQVPWLRSVAQRHVSISLPINTFSVLLDVNGNVFLSNFTTTGV